MSISSDGDFERWRVLWQAGPDPGAAARLRDRVIRATRRRKRMLVLPLAVTIVIGGWIIARARASGSIDDVALAIEVWLFITTVWAGSWWIDRGTWRPLDDSTSAFLDLAIRRCHSALSAVRFGVAMYLLQLTALLAWKWYTSPIGVAALLGSWPAVLLGWIGVPLVICLAAWYRRRTHAELHQLIDLREEWRRE